MNALITSRVEALRKWMMNNDVDAFIIPSTDPHNSEYPADYWKCREWLTGFTGSAGTAIVTLEAAALWTDSRYFLQAEQQLEGTPFVLMRDGEPQTPTFVEWIEGQSEKDEFLDAWQIGYVKASMPYHLWNELNSDHILIGCEDIFEQLWVDRPALPASPLYLQPLQYAGEAAQEKMQRILHSDNDDWEIYIMNDLSEIAWTLNLRGNDIAYNPLFMSYLALTRQGKAVLFTDKRRVGEEVKQYLLEQKVELREYTELLTFIEESSSTRYRYRLSTNISMEVYEWVEELLDNYPDEFEEEAGCLVESLPVDVFRAVKNHDEIEGFRQAMLHDGVALVKFRRWLDERISNGRIRKETEHSVAQKLAACRAENPAFRGLSFATIAGYEANGAIVHYEPTAEHHSPLSGYGLLLLDSGAQYDCGTTDITRTIALGELSEEHRRVYTLVLKGHIALSRARFPEGTTGIQLDLAARYAMWQQGYDFGHGTGHGVGSHLCVHEGPQQIRKNLRACTRQAFLPGMTITNEPGIYVEGSFGVRIENVLLCRAHQDTPFGRFLDFETLTLCPIDTAPIDLSLLDASECAWLNAYHQLVRERLLPLLHDEADRQWLIAATGEI